jgi:hypothetical protein
MHAAWTRFRQGICRDHLRVQRALNFRDHQSCQLKRIIAGVIGALIVLGIVGVILEDVETPQTPLPENILYYALSTIAQSAAALAAILGAWGLWQLDQLRERDRQDQERQQQTERQLRQLRYEHQRDLMGAVVAVVERPPIFDAPEQERTLGLQLEGIRASRQIFGDERRGLIDTLVTFLLVTLAILTLAIIGLAFVDTLCAWVRTIRMCIILASSGLGIGPMVMVWKAARRLRPRPALAVALLALVWVLPAESASPEHCQTHHEPTLNRPQTLYDDGTRAVSTWSPTLRQWQTTVTPPPGQRCTGQLNPRTRQVEVRCR